MDPDQVLFDPELDPVVVLDVDTDVDPDLDVGADPGSDVGVDPGSDFLLPWQMCAVHPGSELVGWAVHQQLVQCGSDSVENIAFAYILIHLGCMLSGAVYFGR